MTKEKEDMKDEVARIVGAYCSREVEMGGETVRYLSEEAERTLVALNLEALEVLKTDEEVNQHMVKLKKSKKF